MKAIAITLLCLASFACGEGDAPDPPEGAPPGAEGVRLEGETPPAGGEGPAEGEGPPACETDEDCAEVCPPEGLGCVCAETPFGDACVPICESDADCPSPPNGMVLICGEGLCVPEGGPPPAE